MSSLMKAGPTRHFALVALIDSVGTGFFLAGSAIFFVRSVGLSVEQVGVGLAVASMIGLVTTVPLGALADRVGARNALVGLHLWRAGWFAVLAFVSGPAIFVVVLTLVTIADRAVSPVLRAFVSAATGPDGRTRTLALMRSVRNVGFSVGAALTAPLLLVQSRPALQLIILIDGASFVLAAAVLWCIQPIVPGPDRAAPTPVEPRPGLNFLLLTAVDAVLSLHMVILSVGVPLWVALHTQAPVWLVSGLFVVNTVLVVALQVRVAGGREDSATGLRAMRRAAAALACCCLLLAAAWNAGPVTATVLLLCAVVALTCGELWESVGSWTLSYRYAREERQSRDLSVFSLGRSTQEVVGPLVITGLVLSEGRLGWICLAGAFLAVMVPLHAVVNRLERARGIEVDRKPHAVQA